MSLHSSSHHLPVQYAIKAAVVEHQFKFQATAAHLKASNVQPVKIMPPVPPQVCCLWPFNFAACVL